MKTHEMLLCTIVRMQFPILSLQISASRYQKVLLKLLCNNRIFKLTFDGKLDCVTRSSAFRIDSFTLVQTTFLPPDFLQNQALVSDDYTFFQTIFQQFTIPSPDNCMWCWVGMYQALKIHIVTLFDVGCIQTSTQTKFCMRCI